MGDNDTLTQLRHAQRAHISAKISCNSFPSVRTHTAEKQRAHSQSTFETRRSQRNKLAMSSPLCNSVVDTLSARIQHPRISTLCACISMQQEEIQTLRQNLRETRFELLRSEIEYQQLFQERKLIQIETDALNTDVQRLTMELGQRGEQVRKLLEKRNQYKAKYKHSEREKQVSERKIHEIRVESDQLLQQVQKARDARDRMQHLYIQLKDAATSSLSAQLSSQVAIEPVSEISLVEWKRIYRRRIHKVAVSTLLGMRTLRKSLFCIRAPAFELREEMLRFTAALHGPFMSLVKQSQKAESACAKALLLESSLQSSQLARCQLQEELWRSRNNVSLVCQLYYPYENTEGNPGKKVVFLEENTHDGLLDVSIDEANRQVVLRDHSRSQKREKCSTLEIRLDCIESDIPGIQDLESFCPLLESVLDGYNGLCLYIDTLASTGSFEDGLKVLKALYDKSARKSSQGALRHFKLKMSFAAVYGDNVCDLLTSNLSVLPVTTEYEPLLTFVERDFDEASDLMMKGVARLNTESGHSMRSAHRVLTVNVIFEKGSTAYTTKLQILQSTGKQIPEIGALLQLLEDARTSEEIETHQNRALLSLLKDTTRSNDKLLLVLNVPATSTQRSLPIDSDTFRMFQAIQGIRVINRQQIPPIFEAHPPGAPHTLPKSESLNDTHDEEPGRIRPQSPQYSVYAKQLTERLNVKASAQMKPLSKENSETKMSEIPRIPPKLLLDSSIKRIASRAPSPLNKHADRCLSASKIRVPQGAAARMDAVKVIEPKQRVQERLGGVLLSTKQAQAYEKQIVEKNKLLASDSFRTLSSRPTVPQIGINRIRTPTSNAKNAQQPQRRAPFR